MEQEPEKMFQKPESDMDEMTSEQVSGEKKHRFLAGLATGIILMLVVGVIGLALSPRIIKNVMDKSEAGKNEEQKLKDDQTQFSGLSADEESEDTLLDEATLQKILVLEDAIKDYYYEDVDTETLQEGLYQGLFDNLDIYSEYFSPEEYKDMYESSMTGEYSGIGATLQQDQESMVVTIILVHDGSPAAEAGLKEGDIIVSADEFIATDMELSDFIKHVRGEESSIVHLVIQREGKKLEFDVERKHLSFPSVEYEMLEDKIGYIRITDFTDATIEQFSNALTDLEKQHMKSLIVDVRSNPGGMVNAVLEILDEILPEGLLVYTEDKNGEKIEYNSTNEKSLDLPLAVLVDYNSASSSEIFAGAIQDREAGTIIGTTTYGKGIIQSIMPLTDGSAFKLTTSRYFTPNGVCIHGVGITPDIEIEYEFLGGEEDEYEKQFDNQLLKAIEVLQDEQ